MQHQKWTNFQVLSWVGLLYFAEGLPFGLFFDLFPLWFRSLHLSLVKIGTLSLLGLAWSMKFLWAPVVDRFSHHRWWIFSANIIMGACLVFFSFLNHVSAVSWATLFIYVICSATNDLAIDGITITLSSSNQLGKVNAVRNISYRIGLIVAGILLALSNTIGWGKTFVISGIILWLNACLSLAMPNYPHPTKSQQEVTFIQELSILLSTPKILIGITILITGLIWPAISKLIPAIQQLEQSSHIYRLLPIFIICIGLTITSKNITSSSSLQLGPAFGSLLSLLKKPGILGTIAFILLYRIGESASAFMIKPFWMDAGFSRQEIGLFSVNLGVALSIIGGIVGGWYVDNNSTIRSLWVLGVIPAMANILYGIAAFIALPHITGIPISTTTRAIVYTASAFDSFSGGLGSAAFMSYLMKITDKRNATSEYAILTSIFAFSRSISGWLGGIGAESLGYSTYFFLTFLLCFPAYLFIPYVRKNLGHQNYKS
ncbi:putative membrane transporter, Major Facilitator Superfamily [Candidatus Ichthyocystis hellenicum]|uniref:Putative membrane transporter, Major Facilitator Superfamily n=1 Tax=Candidatus Ichthyocystis hellenicum TaxID=1561003 RepID=A0A0S4M0D1_9BURK|nr:MFS transporter [Candidatus Ichthyocystis hellenicum]CUT17269.1 putative membrane transporter, Major Facilitator Superfamily [Candidatus Ichthyocystis hellenicum]